MRQPDQLSFEALANAARKPLATLAAFAALAAGVALESPAPANAQPAKPAVPAVSPKEQDGNDSELVPSLAVVAGFAVLGTGTLYYAAKNMPRQ